MNLTFVAAMLIQNGLPETLEGGRGMPVHRIDLSEENEALIADLVDSGQFRDVNEVLREGLRLVEAERQLEMAKERKLREAIETGLEDLNNGRAVLLRSQAEVRSHVQKLGKRAGAKRGSGAD